MLSVSPNSVARSSLEEMLDSLRRRDECERPRDTPPALPERPKANSRKRLPSAKRSLPTNFEVEESTVAAEELNNDSNHGVNFDKIVRRGHKESNSFGAKKMKAAMEPSDSPYRMAVPECEERLEQDDGADLANFCSPVSAPRCREPDCDDSIGYFIKKKLRVWCRPHNRQWELGQIQSNAGDRANVLLSDGSILSVPTGELLPANPDILEAVDNLIQLSYLNEPSVLHNLENRFSQDVIYSKAGPVLIAINPFKKVQLYGEDVIAAYRQNLINSPHVYMIADSAYNEMMNDGINQSIIISGESGAGKTETAKVAMQYLATLGGGSNGIECEVLQTSSILEAFGNAKTLRNVNSSRFGKLIEIHFTALGKICGAKIQTFLLEKSRVVQLNSGERSYHIFYQLCAGAPSSLREKLKLKEAQEYHYLNQSGCLNIHGVDDAKNFHLVTEAFNTLRISNENQEYIFEMLAAVLWLGNIAFQMSDSEGHAEVVDSEAVSNATTLIGCSSEDLKLALTTHKIRAGKDTVAKRLTLQQAVDTRDALAKFIYASLFDWLVDEVNDSLTMCKQFGGRSISVLDIYGFESFKKNSFEQLCINYANERLQQHFNRHLFKLEQEEYEMDGIDWTKVEFEDNQECLNLFENRPIGLISLLDEESNFPKSSDSTLADKLKKHLEATPCFKGERGGGAFSVHHYAGEVTYDTSGFLEKNRDPIHSGTIQLLSSSRSHLSQLFAALVTNIPLKVSSSTLQSGVMDSQKQSVITKFKSQLFKLMQQLEHTTPHFIRCIKPNNKQLPGLYDKDVVLDQLRCCGVLEVVRISRSGYPNRITHQDFRKRYGFLLPEHRMKRDSLSSSLTILQQFGIIPEMYQVGFTKLFFRAGQIGALEEVRKQVLQGTLEVQKCFRGHQARRHFNELKQGVTTLQSFVRGEIARKEFGVLVDLRAQVAQKDFEEQCTAVLQIQSSVRGWLARRHFDQLQSSNTLVQTHKRGRTLSEVMGLRKGDVPSLEELQRRVLAAEANLGSKEKENTDLKEQLHVFEVRWLEYEAKMKSMEDTWQKQMVSLQMSLAAAKKSLGADQSALQTPARVEVLTSPRCYDSEDTMSGGTQTPGGSTPILRLGTNGLDSGTGQETNYGPNSVDHLANEFEHRKQTFDIDVKAIVEDKARESTDGELRRLKLRFETWKKDYKARLREAKAKLQKPDGEKRNRKWWVKKSKMLPF